MLLHSLHGSTAYRQHMHAAAALAAPLARQLFYQRSVPVNTSAVQRGTTRSSTGRPHSAATKAAPSLLTALTDEQKAAVFAKEQHIRVIAGPGSGKTRIVVARVIQLLQQGVAPQSILVITFTRKAAEELQQRLEAEFGYAPSGLLACTFHSLCTKLLRNNRRVLHLGNWTVAGDDDLEAIMKEILTPKQQDSSTQSSNKSSSESDTDADTDADTASANTSTTSKSSSIVRSSRRSRSSAVGSSSGSSRLASSSSSRSSAADDSNRVDSEVVQYYLSMVSAMKNFVETTHSAGRLRTGVEIIQELQSANERRFAELLNPDKSQRLARIYDRYNFVLQMQRKLDFDDLLHHFLALVHHHPEVLSKLHGKWQHVLVDEGQDTNLCQFELVNQITGPQAHLCMVGDPDQAIYGFRGAKSGLLQRRFNQLYPGTAATYYLSDNFRSRPAIITVADLIRRVRRNTDDKLVPGRCKRPHKGTAVQLLNAPSEVEETKRIAKQLLQWQREGYAWNDMAVLCRAKLPLRSAYRAAIASGIPAHIQTGDLWESIEVKTLLALLRSVVHPSAAGEGVRRRLVGSSSPEVKVPLTAGLGGKPVDALAAAVESGWTGGDDSSRTSSTSSDAASSPPMTLGSCLLSGCGLGSLTEQQAADIWQRWEAARAAVEDTMAVLQQLAPKWQPPPGLVTVKALTRPQQAGLDRLRGLVQLATAAATLGQPPLHVLSLLLDHSGIMEKLQQSAAEADDKDKDRKTTRVRNMEVLLDLADRADTLVDDADLMAALDGDEQDDDFGDDDDDDDDGDEEADTASSSSSSSNNNTTASSAGPQAPAAGRGADSEDASALLRQFMDLCALQGDGNEGDAVRPRVTFMTMHSSKGKEFGCVVAMSFYEGVLPSSQAASPEEYEQERNVAYVAVTRAKDNLLITWPSTAGAPRWQPTTMSTFITDVHAHAAKGQLPGVEVSS